ncbi:MAG TPA: hypothetical protein VN931_00670 [Fibrobacteria bacterium]|nr:hypothetical protein [Fibrobacteria bacterium]
MTLLRTLAIVFAATAVSQAMGDRTVFDTTSTPPPANPRKAAPFVVGLELGVNSLSSILGGRATWYPVQQLALDAGGSWSNAGLRGGFGVRWFTSSAFDSPFVGLAWKRASGVDSASLDDGNSSQNTVNINPIQWVDAQVGYEIRRTDGLVVVLTTGWSTVITSRRSTIVSGTLSNTAKSNLDLYTGSGPIAAVAVGIGF